MLNPILYLYSDLIFPFLYHSVSILVFIILVHFNFIKVNILIILRIVMGRFSNLII